MPADTYDSILGLIEQGTGNNNNTWGNTFNNSMTTPVAQAIAGINTITNVGGTVDLSTVTPPAGKRLDINFIQQATGALTSDLTVIVVNISKTWIFWNNTTNAFNMFVKVPGGVARTGPSAPGGLVQIPQGCIVYVACDGNGNLIRLDDVEIGSFNTSGKASAGPGELACNGASLLRAEFPDLFGKIGTTWGSVDGTHFTLPYFTDTNRFLRAGGGSGPAVGTYQSNQNKSHTHTGSGTTSVESATITHNYSGTTGGMSANDPHSHTVPLSNAALASSGLNSSGNPQYTNFNAGTVTSNNTSIAHTHSYSGTTAGQNQNHTHTYSFTTSTGSADGAEARPESAAILICIRY